MIIRSVHAREILDSRGTPTVEAEIVLSGGEKGTAAVPSGASVGKYEAHELRDGDASRYFGKGVMKAVENVKNEIASALISRSFESQKELDSTLIELDGTKNKSRLGANALLAVSLAAARAAALFKALPLYEYLAFSGTLLLPVPMMNVINGGEHASNNIDIQEFMIMPLGFENFRNALRASAEVYMALKKVAKNRSLSTAVGDEGGFAPQLPKDKDALDLLMEAIQAAGYAPRKDFCIAIDAAASGWHQGGGNYKLPKSGISYSREELITYWQSLIDEYPI
ncbi:MAG: phosphopyruvate hydratase, partial [Bacillota bacterium]|nr:phosphopyruvate hydratase [Bacillota bacterium]